MWSYVTNCKEQNVNKRWNFKFEILISEVSLVKILNLKFWKFLFEKQKNYIFEVIIFFWEYLKSAKAHK